MKEELLEELKRVCNARIPKEVFLKSKLEEEQYFLIDYIGKKYNGLIVTEEYENKIKAIGYSPKIGFDKWFKQRSDFYIDKWEKMIKYDGPIVNNYNFLSEALRKLNKHSWFIQNAYQSYSSAKDLLNKLDSAIKNIEDNNSLNKELIWKKISNIYKEEKDWKAKPQSKMSKKEHEYERQIFSFFAEVLVYDEFKKHVSSDIFFLPTQEGKKQPDFLMKKGSESFYIEVKQIREPYDEDESMRAYSMYSGFVNPKFREPLQKKIGDFINDASEKFISVNAKEKEKRILVLDYQEGMDAFLTLNKDKTNLIDIFGESFFKDLEISYNMTILPKKYF